MQSTSITDRLNLIYESLLGLAGKGDKTAMLKLELRKLGEELGYLVVPNEQERQWLYDLVWFKNKDGYLSEVSLVVESELSTADDWHIQEDFEKLLLAKSPLKLFVFQADEYSLSRHLEYFRNAVRIFAEKSPEETYILAALRADKACFEITVLTHL